MQFLILRPLVGLLTLGLPLSAQMKAPGKVNPHPPAASGNPCPRPEPRPIITKGQAGVKAHAFTKAADKDSQKTEATETLELESGDSIKITHWGCKFIMVGFECESKARLSMPTGVAAGYLEAVKVLRQLIAVKARVGFDLEKAAKALEAQAKDPKVSYVKPVPLAKGSRDQITVKGAGPNTAKTAGRVEFEFMRKLS